ASTIWDHLMEIPELYLLTAASAVLSALGLLWRPMLGFLPLLGIGVGYPIVRAALKARQAQFRGFPRSRHFRLRTMTTLLHVLQPIARLWGRMQHGLTPWKKRGEAEPVLPYRREWAIWTSDWTEPHDRLRLLEQA